MRKQYWIILLVGFAAVVYLLYWPTKYANVARSLHELSTDIGTTFSLTQRSANDELMSWDLSLYPSAVDSIGQSLGLVTYYEEGEFFYLERGDRVDEKKLLKDDSLQQGIDEESIIQLLNYFVNHRDLHAVNTNYLCFTLWEFDDFKLKELKQNEECGSVNTASEEMVWGNFELID